MRRMVAVILGVVLFFVASSAFAAGPDAPLARAAAVAASRLAAARALQAAQQPPAPAQRSWVSRHPTLFGALVGTAAGTALGAMEDCRRREGFVNFCSRGQSIAGGAIVGAGVGSLTGFIVGLVKD